MPTRDARGVRLVPALRRPPSHLPELPTPRRDSFSQHITLLPRCGHCGVTKEEGLWR